MAKVCLGLASSVDQATVVAPLLAEVHAVGLTMLPIVGRIDEGDF